MSTGGFHQPDVSPCILCISDIMMPDNNHLISDLELILDNVNIGLCDICQSPKSVLYSKLALLFDRDTDTESLYLKLSVMYAGTTPKDLS